MLDAVVLVLREVLEAALLISLLLALGEQLRLRWRWERVAVPLGLGGAWLLGYFAYPIAAAFDGFGQEMVNAMLYVVAIACFVVLAALLVPRQRGAIAVPRAAVLVFHIVFVAIVACSLAREGAEIWIYLSGFRDAPALLSSALMGGLIGTGIGLSLCALVYYLFALLPRSAFLAVFLVLATLVAAGLSMQLARLALQMGVLDSGPALWDTGALVSERSWFGQFLHAMFGYDANPDRTQVFFYFGTLCAMALGAGVGILLSHRSARAAAVGTAALALSLAAIPGQAATTGVDHPYVNRNEREIEYGVAWRHLDGSALSLQRASLGYAWSDDVVTELYVLSEFPAHDAARVRGYELEVRWQLTEQGEYASDWGLVFEAEVADDADHNELVAGLLWERELGGRFVAAANALVEFEFGDAIQSEFETALRGQLRYLFKPAFEPAIECYLDDIDKVAGPAVLGTARLGAGRRLHWEAGVYFPLDRQSPSTTFRIGLEFEF